MSLGAARFQAPNIFKPTYWSSLGIDRLPFGSGNVHQEPLLLFPLLACCCFASCHWIGLVLNKLFYLIVWQLPATLLTTLNWRLGVNKDTFHVWEFKFTMAVQCLFTV